MNHWDHNSNVILNIKETCKKRQTLKYNGTNRKIALKIGVLFYPATRGHSYIDQQTIQATIYIKKIRGGQVHNITYFLEWKYRYCWSNITPLQVNVVKKDCYEHLLFCFVNVLIFLKSNSLYSALGLFIYFYMWPWTTKPVIKVHLSKLIQDL